jgi:protein-S-isoprenylcysteine O-methyltransferase Ste14
MTAMVPDHDGPGVSFPPTLFFVVGFGVALGLHDAWPLQLVTESLEVVRRPAGTGLLIGGLILFWWGMSTFARARTGIMLERPANDLVMHGPYRFSRNPMYVGFIASYLGLGVLANSLWPLIALPAVVGLFVPFVIRREERYLRSRFGEVYEDYCQRVGRWL